MLHVGELEVTNELRLAQNHVIRDGAVECDGDLSVLINQFFYDLGGVKGKFPGLINQAHHP